MSQDPFNRIPPIQEDAYRAQPELPARETPYVDENVTKGAPPRNLLKSISKVAIPIAGVAIFVWTMLPSSGPGYKKAQLPDPEVDQTKQVAQTNSLIETIKENANKVPLKEPVAPTVMPAPPAGPPPISDAERAEIAKLKAEAERREQEIRGSTLEAGSFKLVSESGSSRASGIPRPSSMDFQERMDATNAMKAEATNALEKRAAAALLANAPKEPAKSKGSNQDFLSEQETASAANDVLRQQASAARYLLNEGTVVRTVLLTGLNSDLPGSMRAQVTSDVYDSTYQRHVLIPKGSQIVGAYNSQVVPGQERMLVATSRLILPDGTWISLGAAPATDMIGQSGMEADVNNHFFKIFGSSLIIGAVSTLLPKDQNTINTTISGGSTTNAGSVIANSLNDTVRTLLERNKQIAPTLTVKPGTEFTFLVKKDMAMNPYMR